MEFIEDPCCCTTEPVAAPVELPADPYVAEPAPYVEPAPVAVEPVPAVLPEPAPAFEPAPAPVLDAPSLAPEPAPVVSQPAPVSAGSLLGGSTLGGGGADFVLTDASGTPVDPGSLLGPTTLGGDMGFVGGSPDLSGSGYVGGSDFGQITVTDAAGNVVPGFDIPVVPGPFTAAAQGMVASANADIVDGILRPGHDGTPAPWTPGFDSDRDGVLNQFDTRPSDHGIR